MGRAGRARSDPGPFPFRLLLLGRGLAGHTFGVGVPARRQRDLARTISERETLRGDAFERARLDAHAVLFDQRVEELRQHALELVLRERAPDGVETRRLVHVAEEA